MSAEEIAAEPRLSKGEEIRAKIAANRAKRLAIAEAMKREAGVTQHDINEENFGGLAYIGTGRIWSPEGKKILELYTVAHECGHIFLHNDGPGYWLPGHVKELEAESYAHQCFVEHGMRLPKRLTKWGRQYVGSWVEKDRAAGIAIDPRAIAYSSGRRSPYAPLRATPDTWKTYAIGNSKTKLFQPTKLFREHAPTVSSYSWLKELGDTLTTCGRSLLYGYVLAKLGLHLLPLYYPTKGMPPELFRLSYMNAFTALSGALVFTCAVILVRTMFRPIGHRG